MEKLVVAIRDEDGILVYIDGNPVKHIVKHSPTGMECGYGGSGPADTAYSILYHLYGKEIAEKYHQQFKWDFIAKWKEDKIEEKIDIDKWLKEQS
jgi:hypothetical protein